MVESNVGFLRPTVNTLPGDFLSLVVIISQLLDGRQVGTNLLMAGDAERHAGQMRYGSLRHTVVTIVAVQRRSLHMNLMCEGNGLDGIATDPKKVPRRVSQRGVSRRKDKFCTWIRAADALTSEKVLAHSPADTCRDDNHHSDARPLAGFTAFTMRLHLVKILTTG